MSVHTRQSEIVLPGILFFLRQLQENFFEFAAPISSLPRFFLIVKCEYFVHRTSCCYLALIDNGDMLRKLLGFFEVVCRKKYGNACCRYTAQIVPHAAAKFHIDAR